MSFDNAILRGGYLDDLLFQPQALADTAAGLRELPDLKPARYRRIVLTGMGGSFHTLYPLHLDLIAHGHTSVMAETGELVHSMRGLLGAGTLVVALSQSGRSAETVRLLDGLGRGVTTIGVTNTADSPLAARADIAVLTQAGSEFSVSSKTVLASLAALAWIGAALGGEDTGRARGELAEAAPAAAGYLARWERHVAALANLLAGVRDVFFAGRGASLAAAGVGGLIIKEAAHVHSEGMSSAAFRHGPFEMLGGEVFVLVFEGCAATAALNRALVEDIRAAGGRGWLAGANSDAEPFRLPEVPARVRPIVEMLPVEMISLALAALGGRRPGTFERITKVTTSE